MAGTISIQNSSAWVTYLNTKATANTTGQQYFNTKELRAYKIIGATSRIRIPFAYGFELTLPAFESDGVTATAKTYTYLNAYHIPMKVTYTGNAIA